MATILFQSFKKPYLVAAVLLCTVALQASAAHNYPDKLVGGESLTAGESINAPNGLTRLIMQSDGNLVLYRLSDMAALWHSQSWNNPGAAAAMQTDGNLVVYGPAGQVLFHTNTYNNPGSRLVLQSDSNLIVYSPANVTLWQSNTAVLAYSTPAYEPNYWNVDSTTRSKNNCYNYSNNKRTDTFAQPGRYAGIINYTMTVAAVKNAALADGMVETTSSATSPQGKTKMALVIAPGYDYHWYRQDSNGRWSHKPGSTPATDLDNSSVSISNPETANRGPYTQFGGYFFTPSDSVQGQGKATIK